MKLARYTVRGRTQIGVVVEDRVYALADLLADAPATLKEVLAGGAFMRDRIAATLASASTDLRLSQVRLEAPVPDAQKYLAIGMNYQDHADEARRAGVPVPTTQLWFNKQVSCITGPFDVIHKPKVSERMDYEAELGVVIGTRCRHISEADALSVVGGYFIANDVTARDWQAASPTFTLGKSFDTHGPIGPWIVTADEIPDPQSLEMRLYVDGELRQKQTTRQMIYSIAQQIAHLSKVMTLHPGDLLATGTCAGVGIALGKFLEPGNVVRVEIGGIGFIENKVVAEP